MFLLFIGLLIPMMCYASCVYRMVFFYFAVRDSCNKAAKASTFTVAGTTATTVFAADMAGWKDISGTESIKILIKPIPSGSPTFSASALTPGTVNVTNNMYFIRETAVGSIHPVFGPGSWLGLSIPGFTGPLLLNIVVDAYVENPSGLTN
ncbi:MAG: hypothetical protein P4L53_18045 [Candidatus Obscuribacterales bacterium]|nr:hypothetical protein [Candidatus Obscuribacterales bacterium]